MHGICLFLFECLGIILSRCETARYQFNLLSSMCMMVKEWDGFVAVADIVDSGTCLNKCHGSRSWTIYRSYFALDTHRFDLVMYIIQKSLSPTAMPPRTHVQRKTNFSSLDCMRFENNLQSAHSIPRDTKETTNSPKSGDHEYESKTGAASFTKTSHGLRCSCIPPIHAQELT